MASKRHVVVLGTGFVGRVHVAAARAAGADVVGVSASPPARARQAAAELGVLTGYDSARDALADPDVDVVHVCTPNGTHADLVRAALSAGKHVVCEKPLTTSAADARALANQAASTGLIGAVPFVYRYHPMAREARARLASGELGAPVGVHGSYLQDWMLSPATSNWRVDPVLGGPSRAFADIGSHWCDLMEWVAGVRIAEVSAAISTTVPKRAPSGTETFRTLGTGPAASPLVEVDTEDQAYVLLRADSGVIGSLAVSQVAAGRKNRLWLEIDAQHGSVVFDQENADQLWVGGLDATTVLSRGSEGLSASAQPYSYLPAGHTQGFTDCFTGFVRDVYRSIDQGSPVPDLPTFTDGARAAAITDAVLTSAGNHSWTQV